MTTEELLNTIQSMAARKQIHASKSISIDTLLLVLKISEAKLLPLIDELEGQGHIKQNLAACKLVRLGTLELINK